MKTPLVYVLCALLAAPLASPAEIGPLRGYSADATRDEREGGSKFRAVPDPANVRAYMQRLSPRPHHVGSPYHKDNAERTLSRFKRWGLDAKIEPFEVLFPRPKDRSV